MDKKTMITIPLDDDTEYILCLSPTESDIESYQNDTNKCYDIMSNILINCGFFNEEKEDLENYYYVCDICNEKVYYYQREEHKKNHNNNLCCCIM